MMSPDDQNREVTVPPSGLRGSLRAAYDRILRLVLPRKITVLNGVLAREPRLFDDTDTNPGYERAFCNAIRNTVRPGDHVVLVGAGRGVSTVHAARCGATVTAFEAGLLRADQARETQNLNDTGDSVTVVHARVSADGTVTGRAAGAPTMHPSDLPPCDVLALDCEGAESTILADIESKPRAVVVETHTLYNTTPQSVQDQLPGYTLTAIEDDTGLADAGTAVVVAEQRNASPP